MAMEMSQAHAGVGEGNRGDGVAGEPCDGAGQAESDPAGDDGVDAEEAGGVAILGGAPHRLADPRALVEELEGHDDGDEADDDEQLAVADGDVAQVDGVEGERARDRHDRVPAE
jgi:hypothetical protein